MKERSVLIEPEEAIRLWGYRGIEDTYRANIIAECVIKHNSAENDRLWLKMKILSTVYNAGRVQGIREERQKRRGEGAQC